MRYFPLTLMGVVLSAATAAAQQPGQAPAQNGQAPAGQAPAANPADPRLDALLKRWEQEMAKIDRVVAHCTRTNVDKTFQAAQVYQGTAKYMKPNLAMLEMQRKDKPQVFEKYICTGTFLYEYAPAEKIIRVHQLPPPKPGQVSEDNFLSFLFGMKAEEAKRRYDLKLVAEPTPDKPWYYYIEIRPRFPADKADFQRARLVLLASSFMPRELWFEQPNGDEVKWDIPKIENGAELKRNDFVQPAVPQGWKMVQAPRSTDAAGSNPVPPRVVRPAKP